MGKSKNNSFLLQGSILAAAGILVRVIGIIYRIPLNSILEKSEGGISSYGIAYDVYSLFLLISSLSLPVAVSKIVSERMARGQIKNAKRAFIGSMTLATVIGLVVSLTVYFMSDTLAKMWKFPSATYAIKVLAPTLFVMCLLGVMRGFFQGIGSMMPTAISQIFEQIINAIVSLVAAFILWNVGEKVGKAAEYSAAGGTLGTALGALTALLFMFFVYRIYKVPFSRMVKKDKSRQEESFKDLSKVLMMTIFPVLLSTTIYNLGSIIDSALYGNIMSSVYGLKEQDYSGFWGIYSGWYRVFTTAPIAIASAMASAIIPSLIRSLTRRDRGALINKVDSAIRVTMIIAIPCGVGLSMLAGPIMALFNVELYNESVYLMRFSVFTVCMYSLSTITNSILQGINKMKLPVIHSAISLGIHLIVVYVLLVVFKLDIYGIVIADFIFAGMVCLMNALSIRKYLGYKQELIKTFFLPGAAAIIMGFAAYFTHKGIFKLLFNGSGFRMITLIGTIIAIIVAVIVYGILLIVFKAIDESEILMIPGGRKLVKIFKSMHLLR